MASVFVRFGRNVGRNLFMTWRPPPFAGAFSVYSDEDEEPPPEGDYSVVDNPNDENFSMKLNSVSAYIHYKREGEVYDLRNVVIPAKYGALGFRKLISKLTFEYIKKHKRRMKLTCPLLRKFLADHKEKYKDIVVGDVNPYVGEKVTLIFGPSHEPKQEPAKPRKEDYVLKHHEHLKKFTMKLNSHISFLQYRKVKNVYNLTFIMVPFKFRNTGVGRIMALLVFDYIAREKSQFVLSCRFLQKVYMDNHAEYAHVLMDPLKYTYLFVVEKVRPLNFTRKLKDDEIASRKAKELLSAAGKPTLVVVNSRLVFACPLGKILPSVSAEEFPIDSFESSKNVMQLRAASNCTKLTLVVVKHLQAAPKAVMGAVKRFPKIRSSPQDDPVSFDSTYSCLQLSNLRNSPKLYVEPCWGSKSGSSEPPQSESGTSKSESDTSKSESETSKSESETSKSESGPPKSESETSKSESGPPKSESETSKSESETSKSDSETSKSESDPSKSGSGLPKSDSGTPNSSK